AARQSEITGQVGECVPVSSIRGAGRSISGTENSERSTRLQRDDAAHLPIPEHCAERFRAGWLARVGQFPNERAREPFWMVAIGQSSRVAEIEWAQNGAVFHVVVR